MLVNVRITITEEGVDADPRIADERNNGIMFKNCASVSI